MASTYRVVLNGVSSGQEVDRVATQLASLSKIPVETARTLLATTGTVVKRAVDLQAAARYVTALQMVGCDCVFESEATEQETLALDPAVLQSVANQGTAAVGRSPASDAVEAASRVAAEPRLSASREPTPAPQQRASHEPAPDLVGSTLPKHEDAVTPTPSSSSKPFLGLELHHKIFIGGFILLLVYGLITAIAPSKNSEVGSTSSSSGMHRDNFKDFVVGKTPQEVIANIGRPNNTATSGTIEMWYYDRMTFDPVTGRRDSVATVIFMRDRVTSVSFLGGR